MAGLSAFAVTAVPQAVSYTGRNPVSVVTAILNESAAGFGILWFVLWVACFLLFKKTYVKGWRFKASAAVTGGLFSLFMLFGYSFKTAGSWSLVVGSFAQCVQSLLLFLGYLFLFCACISQIFRFLNTADLWPQPAQGRVKSLVFERKPFLSAWIIIFAAWLPYIILCFPGTMLYDSVTQAAQFFGIMPMNSNNPVFQTMLVGAALKLGGLLGSYDIGVFVYTTLQALMFSAALALSLWYMGRLKLPVWVRLTIMLLYALLPVFPSYAITMGKDINFGIAVLLLTIFLFEMVRRPESIIRHPWRLAALAAVMLLLCLLRNAGVMLAAVCAPFIIVLARRHWARVLAVLAGVFCVTVIYSAVILPALNIEKGTVSENMSIPLQQTARFAKYHGDEATAEEIAVISEVVDYSGLAESYNPEISDPVKALFKTDATADQISAYYGVWFKQMQRRPLTYLQATLNNAYGYFYPDDKGRQKGFVFFGYPSNIDVLEGMDIGNMKEPSVLPKLVYALRNMPGIGVMMGVGFYSWMLILAIAYLAHARRKKFWIVLLPCVLVLLGCIGSPVNAYFRYALPLVFTIPTVAAVCVYAAKERRSVPEQSAGEPLTKK